MPLHLSFKKEELMAKRLTEKELAEIGRKVVEQGERAKLRGKARIKALQRLVSAHETEFNTFLDEEKTLTDQEIDGWMNKIMSSLEKDLQAEIRK